MDSSGRRTPARPAGLPAPHRPRLAAPSRLLDQRGIDDVVIFGGGIIPDEDMAELQRLGVARVFTPGATTTDIVDWVRENVGAPTGA